MSDVGLTEYELQRDRARSAIERQKAIADADRIAREERDAAIVAMLKTSGASLSTVAADVGLSKSMIAYIDRTARARFDNAERARAYLEQHDA